MVVQLESLSNELLLDLFEYMSISQILHSFQSLNSRFNQLIFAFIRTTRHLNLRFISLRNFTIICHSHLPHLGNQIISIHLSNETETPLQIQLFHSANFSLYRFTNLQSLTLHHICSEEINMEMTAKWDHFPRLTHLNLTECRFSSSNEFLRIINKVWSMPNLIHVYISAISDANHEFSWPSTISLSLKYVSIQNLFLNRLSLYNLFRCTPHIQCLRVYLNLKETYSDIQFLPCLVELELIENLTQGCCRPITEYALNDILRNMPNLCHLSVELIRMPMDGHEWENLITNYLPKLKVFRCKITAYFLKLQNLNDRVNNLLQSFQSDFWLESRQWFIRCHWNSWGSHDHCIIYYTLPYTFSHSININDYLWSKSTSPYQSDHWPSGSVHKLVYRSAKGNSLTHFRNFQQSNTSQTSSVQRLNTFRERILKIFRLNSSEVESMPSSVVKKSLMKTCFTPSLSKKCLIPRFTTIRELDVELPFDKYFLYFIPKFDQLISLNVLLSTDDTDQSHLQFLLDRAPNLYSLSVVCSLIGTSKCFLTYIRSASIRRLNLRESMQCERRVFYDMDQCIELTRSPLGKQCEILSIGVKDRKSILYLIKEMINLRVLNVHCQDDKQNEYIKWCKIDKLAIWLRLSLPYTIKIIRDDWCETDIHLWIR